MKVLPGYLFEWGGCFSQLAVVPAKLSHTKHVHGSSTTITPRRHSAMFRHVAHGKRLLKERERPECSAKHHSSFLLLLTTVMYCLHKLSRQFQLWD